MHNRLIFRWFSYDRFISRLGTAIGLMHNRLIFRRVSYDRLVIGECLFVGFASDLRIAIRFWSKRFLRRFDVLHIFRINGCAAIRLMHNRLILLRFRDNRFITRLVTAIRRMHDRHIFIRSRNGFRRFHATLLSVSGTLCPRLIRNVAASFDDQERLITDVFHGLSLFPGNNYFYKAVLRMSLGHFPVNTSRLLGEILRQRCPFYSTVYGQHHAETGGRNRAIPFNTRTLAP